MPVGLLSTRRGLLPDGLGRVIRGGGWGGWGDWGDPRYCRSAYRGYDPDDRADAPPLTTPTATSAPRSA
jgi:formylglycine-generating enzyme required for sulfatase activity